MKKILMFLVIFLSFSVLFAAVDANAQMGSADSTKTEGDEVKAYVEVKVSIGTSEEGEQGSDDAGQKVVVGFKKSALTNTATNITTSVDDAYTGEDSISMKLEPDYSVAHLSADTPLHAFWQIQSGKTLKVSLYASGPLSNENGDELGWSVYQGKATLSNGAYTGTELLSDSTDETQAKVIYTHGEDGIMGNAGSLELDIVTNSYALNPTGTYTGYLYIKVSDL